MLCAPGRATLILVAFCKAAYTGARRSEILRSRVDDCSRLLS
jgi:hypothetical protein